jgi:amidase
MVATECLKGAPINQTENQRNATLDLRATISRLDTRAERYNPLQGEKTMSAFTEYENFDALGLAGLVRSNDVTPVELLEAAIQRVEARNPAINAVTMKLYDHGKKAIADGLPDGPFRGVPYLMKDLTSAIAGVRMTRGSTFFADTPPSSTDSEHVKRLKRAGLVIFGRTNTCELGLSLTCEPQLHGPTRNPWNVEHISGGSSGGAAAAVAARILPIAHASDGFGSIRAPAACCGLVGLKPTRGRNTFAPFIGEGLGGAATEHAVSLTVRDTAALLDATHGAGPGDPYVAPAPVRPYLDEVSADPGRLRVAWTSKAPNGAPIDAECLRLLEQTAQLCADLGHHVEECNPDIDGTDIVPAFLTLAAANTVVNLATHPTAGRPAREGEVERITWLTAKMGEKISAPDYVRATQTAHRLGRQMAAFHSQWDVLLTPGLASPAAKLGWLDMMMDDVDEYWQRVFRFSPFTVWFNLTGQPGMMLPLGQSTSGLPLAVQLVAPFGDEATLFRLGAQLEAARPWIDRKPVLADSP